MGSEDEDRRALFDVLEAGLGGRGAALLMAHLPPVGWSELATRSDLDALRLATKSDLDALRLATKSDLDALRAELHGDMAELKTELRTEMADLRIELHDRLSGLVPRLWAANVATMIGLAGLVFAVASFAR